ncbi:uncharacterized protein LOC398921 isoform X1 [Xenopus laevis]|uniref:Uncharacterized protein LOC398921 isoform X1 n=1 Tax=Xenopus laevis TaxID=8355 RepID=A0A8J1N0C5_XENLA|nr:uncharacterized protein LOC398921 isoform X1 [Xenopus laevis]
MFLLQNPVELITFWLYINQLLLNNLFSTGDLTVSDVSSLLNILHRVHSDMGSGFNACYLAAISMYFDEDGDLAHEFYEETVVMKNGRKRAKLKRIQKNLRPQGIIRLDHPCLHVDFPVVICEV